MVGDTLAGAACALLDILVTDDHDLVTIIEGEGSGAADTRRITEWLQDHRPESRPRCTTAASPSTRTCSPSSDGAGTDDRGPREPAPGASSASWPSSPVAVLDGVGTEAERELAELGIETVLDLVTHYPRRYIDGTRLVPIAELAEGEKASVLAEVTRVRRAVLRLRAGPATRPVAGGGGDRRRQRPARRGLLQPGLAGQAAPGRHPGPVLRYGRRPTGAPSS